MQCQAILRHLARCHGLAGASVQEAALVDVLLEGIADLSNKIMPLIYMPDKQVGLGVRSCTPLRQQGIEHHCLRACTYDQLAVTN